MLIANNTESVAILVHTSAGQRSAVVTAHNVIKAAGGFTLSAGRLFSQGDKARMLNILGDDLATEGWVNDRLLYLAGDTAIWYAPACVRDIVLDEQVMKDVPYPGMVFVIDGAEFSCFAYKGKSRPRQQTNLYYAPLPNYYRDGTFCLGNTNPLRGTSLDAMNYWERFVYEANGTHLGTPGLVNGIKTWEQMIALWSGVAGTKAFQSDLLKPTHRTVGDLV